MRSQHSDRNTQVPDWRKRLFGSWLLLVLFGMLFGLGVLHAVAATDASIAYRSNTGTCPLNALHCPKVRVWDSAGTGSWQSPVELASADSAVRQIVMAASPVSQKRIVITLGDDGNLDGYVCRKDCSNTNSWVTSKDIGKVWDVPTAERRFSVEFESTGDALLAYGVRDANGTHDWAYRMLPANRDSFSDAETYVDDDGHTNDTQYTWMALARNSSSEQMVMVGFDATNQDINAWVWNGSSWGNRYEISANAIATSGGEALAAAYTADGSLAMVIGADGGAGEVKGAYWRNGAWVRADIGDLDPKDKQDTKWLTLTADPASDDLQAVSVNGGTDLDTMYWNGASWSVTPNIDTTIDTSATRPADFAWYPTGGKGMLVWDTDTIGTGLRSRTCSPQCAGASTSTSTYLWTGAWLTLFQNPTAADAVDILGVRLQSTFDVGGFRIADGVGMTNYGDKIITDDARLTTFEAYSMAFDSGTTGFPTVQLALDGTIKRNKPLVVTANVSDNVRLDRIVASITTPNGAMQNITMLNATFRGNTSGQPNTFRIQFNDTKADGTYTIRISANDSDNNVNDSVSAALTTGVIVGGREIAQLSLSLKNKNHQDIETELALAEVVSEELVKFTYRGDTLKHDIAVPKGRYLAVLKPKQHLVKEIVVEDLSVEDGMGDIMDIDDLPETAVPKLGRDKPDWSEVYAINPKANYSFATVTITAKGTKLYKCKGWDFDARACNGAWVEHMDLVPGENYTITLDADDPGFGEIPITDAMHLDSAYNFISNVYEEVKAADNVWSEQIPEDDYVRVTFQQSLSSGNVVNIIARAQQNTESILEIYVAGTTTLVGSTGVLTEGGQQHDIELQNLDTPTDLFDIKVVNNDAAANRWVEFDYIHDQRIPLGPEVFVDRFEPVASGALITNNWTLTNISTTAARWVISSAAGDLPGGAIAGRNGSINCDISSGGCVMGLKRTINTTGVMNVSVNMTVSSAAMDAGEYIRVFALNSSRWVNILDATGAALSKTTRLWNSSGNGGFHFNGFNLSFACGHTGTNELCRADNVTIHLLENRTPTVTGANLVENISTFVKDTVVNLSVNASDDMGNRSGGENPGISVVEVNVTVPNFTTFFAVDMFTANDRSCGRCAWNYSALFNVTDQIGQYNVTFLVNDTVNNENWTVKTRFNISAAPGDTEFPNISRMNASGTRDPSAPEDLLRGYPINLSTFANDTVQLDRVFIQVEVPNGTRLPNISLYNRSNGDAWNTTQQPNNFSIQFNDTAQNGTYIVRFSANDTAGNVNDSASMRFDVHTCGRLTTDLRMTQALSVGGTCFVIETNNIDLECAGNTVTYAADFGRGFAVQANASNNLTIRDCAFSESTTNAVSAAINFTSVNDSLISNTSVAKTAAATGEYGIALNASRNISMYNVTVTMGTGQSGYGVLLDNVRNSSIRDSRISITSASNGGDRAISAQSSSDIWISNSTLNVTADSGSILGVYFTENPMENNSIIGNAVFVRSISSGTSTDGIILDNARWNTVSNNSITTWNADLSVALDAGIVGDNTLFQNNISVLNAINTDSVGLRIQGKNNTFTRTLITIRNGTGRVDGVDSSGVVRNNTFRETTIINENTAAGSDGISLTAAHNTTMIDTIVQINCTQSCAAIRLDAANDSFFNNTFINSTLKNDVHWILAETVTLTSIGNDTFWNTTFRNWNASINFYENFTISRFANLSADLVSITANRTFINTTNLTFLQGAKANVTLNLSAFSFTNPRVWVDPEDDGGYIECPSANCTRQEWDSVNELFKFNVSHWSAYAASDNDSIFPNVSYINSTGGTLTPSTTTNISVNVTDEGFLNGVVASIRLPDNSLQNITLYNRSISLEWNRSQSPNNFSFQFNDTSQTGAYTIRIAANDTFNHLNDTVTAVFTVAAAGDTEFPNVSSINTSDGFGSSVFGRRTPVNISAYVNDTGQLSYIGLNIEVPNGTKLPNISMLNGSTQFNRTQQPNNFTIRFNDTSQTGTYILRVLANDTSNNMNDTITSRFDVTSVVSFTILTSSISFGSLANGELQDTADDTPVPFRFENDGNVAINLTVNGTTIFNSSATNSSSYQFQCGTAAGGSPTESACNSPAPTSFTNLPLANISVAADKKALAIFDLPWQSTNDSLAVDIRVNVPDDEPGGAKTSTITIEAVEATP